MTRLILLFGILLCSELALAQYAYFGTRGKIMFDKITYTRARMRDMMADSNPQQQGMGRRGGMGMGMNLDNIPESNTQNFELFFDDDQTLLRAVDVEEQNPAGRSGPIRMRGGRGGGGTLSVSVNPRRVGNTQKTIYQNLKTGISEIQVTIDDSYILTDTLDSITWRFTDEYRNIAGYECRRVNGATKDSLYLIAFYTDQIPVSSGPALLHGLPGMVLGLVIPEMHIHYWATAVDYSNDPLPNNWKDKKATPMPLNEFSESFGRYFQRGGNNDSYRLRVLEQLIY